MKVFNIFRTLHTRLNLHQIYLLRYNHFSCIHSTHLILKDGITEVFACQQIWEGEGATFQWKECIFDESKPNAPIIRPVPIGSYIKLPASLRALILKSWLHTKHHTLST
uniref:Uncharacterized protein n=1 Tax=Cacopsylla melanoneura TaxID=428564 RepID=A0A8D8URW6_9HEMI